MDELRFLLKSRGSQKGLGSGSVELNHWPNDFRLRKLRKKRTTKNPKPKNNNLDSLLISVSGDEEVTTIPAQISDWSA